MKKLIKHQISTVIFFSLICVLGLSSCSSSPERFNSNKVRSSNYEPSGFPLYADLNKINGKWKFTRINNSGGDVELGTYTKKSNLNIGKYEKECTKALWLNIKKCSESEFISQELTVVPTEMFFKAVVWPLWGAFGFSTRFKQQFDWSAYYDAINEAKANDSFDAKLTTTIQKYEDLAETVMTKSYHNRAYRQGNDEVLNTIKDEITFRVVNNSGLESADYLVNRVSKSELKSKISVSMSYDKNIAALVMKDEYISLNNLASTETLSEFSGVIENTQNKINAKRESIGLPISGKSSNFNVVVDSLKRGSGVSNFTASNSLSNLFQGYNIQVDLPENERLVNGKLLKPLVIPIYILSKDHLNVIPKKYFNKNEEVEISLSGNRLSLSNKTSKYITMDALSLYYGEDILTKDNYNKEIPPNSYITLHINDFELSKLNNDYYNLTQKKAENIFVTFGFAYKYKITGEHQPKSLYQTKEYKLADFI